MSKILIAIKSCHLDLEKGCHDIIRQTWGKDIENENVWLVFCVGKGAPNFIKYKQNDEISINSVEDDYDHLPHKTKAILQWSNYNKFDYTFLCDVDTFLIPSKLMKTNFTDYDYSGRFGTAHPVGKMFNFKDGRGIRHPDCHPFASGGFGYFLSRKAAQIVANTESTMWAEDMMVGDILGPKIISGEIKAADLQHFENEASWHYPAHQLGWTRERMKQWMHDMYKEYL